MVTIGKLCLSQSIQQCSLIGDGCHRILCRSKSLLGILAGGVEVDQRQAGVDIAGLGSDGLIDEGADFAGLAAAT